MINKTKSILAAFVCAASLNVAHADGTAEQQVTFEVKAINQISVSGSPDPLIIDHAVAGAEPTPVMSTPTFYSLTTNELDRVIYASMDQTLTTGFRLFVNLQHPQGGQTPFVQLGAGMTPVVIGIQPVAATGLGIQYRFEADATAGTLSSRTATVTFTILTGGEPD